MAIATITDTECRRMDVLDRYRQTLRSTRTPLVQLVKLATLVFDVPFGVLSLAAPSSTPIAVGFELDSWALEVGRSFDRIVELTVIADARHEPEWTQHPRVQSEPHLQFLAAVPLRSPTGIVVGVLAVADCASRSPSKAQRDALVTLGQQAISQLELQPHPLNRVEAPFAEPTATQTNALGSADRCLAVLARVQQQLARDRGSSDLYDSILESLGIAASASRAYLFENHRDRDGRLFTSRRTEWCAPNITPQIQNPHLQDLPYDTLAQNWFDHLNSGYIINQLVADIPTANDRALFDEQGVLSLLLVPLSVRGEFWGFVGFDNCLEAALWSATEVDLLTAAAVTLSVVLENQQVQLTLLQQEAFIAGAMEAERTGQWTWNTISDTVSFDTASQALMDVDPADMPMSWAAWCARIYPEDRRLWTQALQAHLDNVEREFRCERRILTRDGRTLWFTAVGSSSTDEQGLLRSLTVTETDITETKLATELDLSLERVKYLETQLEIFKRRDRSKDDFLNTVSHELRAPMANMKLSIQMLKLAPGQDKQQQYLNILERECTREIALVDDLLDLQRLDHQDEALALSSISLVERLAPTLQSFRLRAEQRQLELHEEIDDVVMTTEPQSLQRVFDELLHNAYKYTPPKGSISLTARARDAMLSISVSNSGNPISAEHLPHVFERFYRVPHGDRWEQGGTGLGLTLVQKLVNRLGGHIRATSNADLTTFHVDLPLALEQANSERTSEAMNIHA
ncbi:MAG: ATP-binding protein [Cyanobacteria bacterium P01_D01_bin.123]